MPEADMKLDQGRGEIVSGDGSGTDQAAWWYHASAMLTGIASAILAMVAMLNFVGPRSTDLTLAMTRRAKSGFQPEKDLQIYVLGCLLALFLPLVLSRAAKIAAKSRSGSPVPPRVDQLAWSVAWFSDMLICVGVWVSSLYFVSASNWKIPGSLALGSLVFGILIPFLLTVRLPRLESLIDIASPPLSEPSASNRLPHRVRDTLYMVAVAALILAVLWTPNPSEIAGIGFVRELCHHWDYYAVGPALQIKADRALGVEAYSQYGVGFPLLLEAVSAWAPLRYDLALGLANLLVCLYFISLAGLLRLVLGSWTWAAIALLFSINLQMFTGLSRGSPKFLYPSTTVIRCLFDSAYFTCLWLLLGTGRARWAVACGLALGASLPWGNDTGIYLLIVTVAVSGLIIPGLAEPFAGQSVARRLSIPAIIMATAAALAFTVWSIAAKGPAGPAFFGGLYEALIHYPGGFACIPMSTLSPLFKIGFLCVAGTYLMGISAMLRVLFEEGKVGRPLIFSAAMGAYGLALMLIFVQRSHFYNLSHGIIPFVMLAIQATKWLTDIVSDYSKSARVMRSVATPAALVLAVLGLLANPHFRTYPGFLKSALRPANPGPVSFPEVGVTGLNESWKEQIEVYRKAAAALASAQAAGQRVGILCDDDTFLCMASGIPPIDRYSPLQGIVFKEHLDRLVENICQGEFDLVCIVAWDAKSFSRFVGPVAGSANGNLKDYRGKLEAHFEEQDRIGDYIFLKPRHSK